MSLSYDNLKAVDNLNFTADFKEILCLLGPNGAGKTSLIRMICGLLKPDSGSINYFDSSGENIRLSQTRIGYCPQHLSIWYDLTCYEQLIFLSELYSIPKKKSKKQIEFLLENLHLTDKKNVPAGKLSGGMQQSLNIAMAMINAPDILILDEPFTGLDIQVRYHIRQMLCSFAHDQGKALILSTHNLDEAEKLADRIIIMDHGTIHESDSSEILKQQALKPIEMNIRNRSLEDLFIELTGRRQKK